MRSLALAWLASLTAACATAPTAALADSQPSTQPIGRSLIIASVMIIDPESGSTSAPQDVFIEAGRIVRIAPAGTGAAPQGAQRIDGSGQFVMAGLIDVHAHVGEGGIAPTDDAARERALRQFLSYGVTTIFVPAAQARTT